MKCSRAVIRLELANGNHASGPVVIFPSVRALRQAAALLVRQQRLIVHLNGENDRLRMEKDVLEVAYMRIGRDLIEQFLVAIEKPEIQDELRDRLSTALGVYRDEIAVREEHVG